MQEIGFDCPETLAQKFWIACRLRKMTPGAALRELRVRPSRSDREECRRRGRGMNLWKN
jgi:hypothetical protein